MENVIIDVEEMRQELTGINQQLEIHINSQYDLINSLEDYVNDLELTGKAMKATKIYTEQIKIVLLRAYIVVLEYFMETNATTLLKLDEAFEDEMELLDYQALVNEIEKINSEINQQNNTIFERFVNPWFIHPSLERKRDEYHKLIDAIQYFDGETKSLYQDIDLMIQDIIKNNEITMGNHSTQEVKMTWTHPILVTHDELLEELKKRGYDLELIYEDLSKCSLEERDNYKKSLTLNLDGLQGADWSVVQELLNRDKEDPLLESQYEALIYLVDGMTTKQLEKFTNMAIKNNKALNFSELSEVFVELSKRYFHYGEAASLMISSGYESEEQLRKYQLIIAKEIILDTVCMEFSKQINGCKVVTIGEGDKIGRYHVNVAHTENKNPTGITGLGQDYTTDNAYDIYDWGSPITLDEASHIHMINWMEGMNKSKGQIVGDSGIASATEKALMKLGGMANVSPHLAAGNTAVMLLSSLFEKEQLGKEISMNTSIIKESSYYETLAISGSLVVSHSDSTSSIEHSTINCNHLEVHINEYNKSTKSNISTDVVEGLFNSEKLEDLENLTSWYTGIGNLRVKSYWVDIARAMDQFQVLNNSFEKSAPDELQIDELKEFIKVVDVSKLSDGKFDFDEIDHDILGVENQ